MPTAKTTEPEAKTITADMDVTMIPWSLGAQMATTWIDGVTRMNDTWAHFVADRLKQDAEIQHDIFTCGSPLEAQRLGAEFLLKTMQDYMSEADRISSMGFHTTEEASLKT